MKSEVTFWMLPVLRRMSGREGTPDVVVDFLGVGRRFPLGPAGGSMLTVSPKTLTDKLKIKGKLRAELKWQAHLLCCVVRIHNGLTKFRRVVGASWVFPFDDLHSELI